MPRGFNDKDSLEKTFNEYKKDAIELWTNLDGLDVRLVMMIGSQLSATLTDSLKYFYADFYKNADNSVHSGEKISKMSDEFIRRLHKLDDFNRTYVDALRFLDDDKTKKGLNRYKCTDNLIFINAPLNDKSVLFEIDDYKIGKNLKLAPDKKGN